MNDELSPQRLVPALQQEWRALEALLADLREDEWSAPSGLPGWSVQDVAAHIIGTERMLSGEPTPQVEVDPSTLPHVHNDIAARNECWVRSLRGHSPAAVLAAFREVTARRLEALQAMGTDDFAAAVPTPVGQASYGRFMRIRVFDCWLHEQDIRHALGRPGHEGGPVVDAAFEEITGALGYLVGKRAQAPDGARVRLELTGAAARTLHVAVDGRAAVVPALDGPATAALRLDAVLFARLVGGRTTAAEHRAAIAVDGDAELGNRLAEHLAFTI
ncbi:maleylpyruvate isomerase family mycothiol-dependent enzyme [Salinifilum aidingensis]